MKNILIILLTFITLSINAQSDINGKNVYARDSLRGKFLTLKVQTTYPTNPSHWMTINYKDTLKTWNGSTWLIIATLKDLAGKQDTLSFIGNFDNRYLSHNGEFLVIEPPAGGYANNLYLDTLTSPIYPSYKSLTYDVSANTYTQNCVVNSGEGNKVISTFLYPSGVGITTYPSGLWAFNFYGKINSASGVTNLGAQYFARTVGGAETNLFTVWSAEIDNTATDEWIKFSISQPNFIVNSTDRMGLRLLAKTDAIADRTITVAIGNGYGAYLNTPNRIRHSQLRDLNGDTAFLHVRNQDTAKWNAKQNAIPNLGDTAKYYEKTELNRDTTLANYKIATRTQVASAIDFALTGTLESKGNWSVASATLPSTSVLIGDKYTITNGTVFITPDSFYTGDVIIAKIDNPGQTVANWNHIYVNQPKTVTIVSAGSSVNPAVVGYTGLTPTNGKFDGGVSDPTSTANRLNFNGIFYATNFVASTNTGLAFSGFSNAGTALRGYSLTSGTGVKAYSTSGLALDVEISGTGNIATFSKSGIKASIDYLGKGTFNGGVNVNDKGKIDTAGFYYGKIKVVETQFDKTNDSVPSDIPELKVYLTAGCTYKLICHFYCSGNAASYEKYKFNYTGTVNYIVYNDIVGEPVRTSINTAIQGYAGTNFAYQLNGTIKVTTSGWISIKYAQWVPSGSYTNSILVGSTFEVKRIN